MPFLPPLQAFVADTVLAPCILLVIFLISHFSYETVDKIVWEALDLSIQEQVYAVLNLVF